MGSIKIFLFKSQFQFLNEEQCLKHYEKGISKGLFCFDRSRINQVWSELGLWGLVGRAYPVDLVRILCAFGCNLAVESKSACEILIKTFSPVTYSILISNYTMATPDESHITLSEGVEVPIFIDIGGQKIIGHFYTTNTNDADTQFPKFCQMLEHDECLSRGSVHKVLL